MTHPQHRKCCMHCKTELFPNSDLGYKEIRFSYTTEEEPDLPRIAMVYVCNICAEEMMKE